MNTGDMPIFAMLRGRLSYLSARQRVLAENIANASTAGYVPKDLKPFNMQVAQASASPAQAVTRPGHMTAPHGGAQAPVQAFKPVASPDSEVTLDGNAVVLEEQMMKMTEARMNYDAAIGFYQKSLNLLRLATRPPGR